jgi:hypothetical protein
LGVTVQLSSVRLISRVNLSNYFDKSMTQRYATGALSAAEEIKKAAEISTAWVLQDGANDS